MKHLPFRQTGASLIEVLVAVLILSFGMLALGGMLSYAVQMPKLSGFRSSATNIATSHIERMRANIDGFTAGKYASASVSTEPHTYNIQVWQVASETDGSCSYPNCNASGIAHKDINETHTALRRELPGWAGMRVTCSGACDSNPTSPEGDIWIIWSEPATFAALNSDTSDECPDPSSNPTFTPFVSPKPRCLHMRFKL
jgi:type IV pilus assembly protein PilV